jgi:hypothetical protein
MSKLNNQVTPEIDELSERLVEVITDEFLYGHDPTVIKNTIRMLIVRNFLGEEAIQDLIEDLDIFLQIYALVERENSDASSH